MTNTRLELCNMIRMEAEHISDTGFPLDVFPQAVQSVILDMDRYENYKTEFIATAMLSAVSAALGGTYRIRIKGEWQSNAALYIILVGRPGLGKTPPLEAAYRPIRKHDYALFKAYETELEAWKYLVEEYTDVYQCAMELVIPVDWAQISEKEKRFKERWKERENGINGK